MLTVERVAARSVLLRLLILYCFVLNSQAGDDQMPGSAEPSGIRVYWGDTHVHTSNSFDAGRYTILVGPEEAYRFARGEEISTDWGSRVKLTRPLDFLVVADHAGNMGVWNGLRAADPILLEDEEGRRWYEQFSGTAPAKGKAGRIGRGKGLQSDAFMRSVWERACAIADRLNQPGVFTALIGYEWTPQPKGNNLHRVVVFKDGADRTARVQPFSAADSVDVEDLWQYMARYEEKTGGDVLAIPHNANMSNGQMFALQTFSGEPLTRDYASTRARWEPLVEVTQLKGAGETHPALSPNDEFANYRIWDLGNMWAKQGVAGPNAKLDWMLPNEYARSVLNRGLDQEAELGVNPFKFGLIGGTDSHTGLPTTWNDSPIYERDVTETRGPSYAKRKPSTVGQTIWEQAAGGLAGIWANGNTRESLFEAMERRETFATTGPRIAVRFFAGWEFLVEDALRPDLASVGYAKGIPMGGDLTHAPGDRAPSLLVQAVKDPDGANLDRVQVIKGWRDRAGNLHERVHDVALSDGRKADGVAKVAPVGNTVDVEKGTYTNTIGDGELRVVWVDPDFDAAERAFYYVRVLEIPTPRWTDFDSLGVDESSGFPMTIVERAYTSPIWYTP